MQRGADRGGVKMTKRLEVLIEQIPVGIDAALITGYEIIRYYTGQSVPGAWLLVSRSEACMFVSPYHRGNKEQAEDIMYVKSCDAYKALQHFRTHEFGEMLEVLPGVQVKFKVAGHILGSAIVEVFVNEDGKTTKLVFTGDIGQPNQPIIEDPEEISGADFIITESTYGNRVHKAYDKEAELSEIINDTVAKGGNVVIPAFAVGRTQVLLYYFQKLLQEGRIPQVPIIIDSPMASKATAITLTNPQEYDEEARALYEMHGNRLLAIPNLRFTATAQESRMINEMPGPKIIVSASGMADAGRILHHLKHNLWHENCSVIIAGYQAEGTMGRRLIEGSKQVKIMGEDIKVNAKIYNMKGFSAHADKEQLLEWYGKMKQPPKAFFVTHGEFDAASNFADELQRRLGTAAYIPQYGDSVTINGTEWNVTTSNIVTTVPEVAALREYLRQFESSYLQYRTKIEQIVARDGDKAAGIRKKMEKIRKYVDDMLSSL